MENRPQGREKNVTGKGKGIKKRGDGLNTGPVGTTQGYAGREESSQSGEKPTFSRQTRAIGGGGLLIIIILAFFLLRGGGLSSLFGGGSTPAQQQTQPSGSSQQSSDGWQQYNQQQQQQQQQQQTQPQQQPQPQTSAPSQGFNLGSLFGGSSGYSSGWATTANTGRLNTSVASGSRAKRTQILGGGNDTVTIMVYMCGTDLESRSSMGTADLMEMASATLSDKVNIIVFTGGCKAWKNNVVSSSVNQVYKVEGGGLRLLVENAGTSPMVAPENLASFIKFCTQNFPANRNELIFWDHGGGSLSGYGYDEKYPNAGSMTLQGISQALEAAGTTFDFIGFDACLMATYENALAVAPYADYLIASEETEPGVGWYYTNWLTNLSRNTSMSTLEVGKNIVDDFVTVCNQKCPGQMTTLSVVDLAELEKTVPGKFKQFSTSTSKLLQGNNFKTVSNARSTTREFASSTKIDQVDLVHLAYNLDTAESRALADALLGAVKYNLTSSSITNAYGLSIYFPYQRTSKVDTAVAVFNALGVDSEYTRFIQQFASMEVGGQAISGGASSPLSSLLGGSSGGSSGMMSSDLISGMLNGLLGGNLSGVSGLNSGNSGFLGRGLDVESATQYLTENRFNSDALVWTKNGDSYEMVIPEDQWALVHDLELNVFFDDGEGFIDLGLDNVFEFTDDAALIGEYDGTWLAINDQPIAYYHTDTFIDGDNYTITGRVPIMLNDSRAELILVFDSENPKGYVAGVRTIYADGETETIAKGMEGLEIGDKIDFICDYYTYDGKYENSYYLGDPMEYDGDLTISDVYIDADSASAMYRITDIYCQEYWTPEIPQG